MNRLDHTFEINIKRLVLLSLPTWLRKPLCGALLFAGVNPLARLLGELRLFRNDTGYRLSHNGQVCKLRAVINDALDPVERRMRIEDLDSSTSIDASRIWVREEERWTLVPQRSDGAAHVFRQGFGGTGGYDFWICVPLELLEPEKEARLKALVDMYKLASKRYTINYF